MSTRFDLKCERFDTSLGFVACSLQFTRCEIEEEDVFNVTGVIGDDWDGLGAADVVPFIQNSTKPLRFRMNTPGGFVKDALDIYDAMVNHREKVTVDIVSMAWSAGTILSAGADETRIAPAAQYGLHRSWGGMLLSGNEEELGQQIKQIQAYRDGLVKLDRELADMIALRTGNNLKTVHDWMVGPEGCDGTEFIGREAVEAGLVDSLIETKERAIVDQGRLRAAAQASYLKLVQSRAGMGTLTSQLKN